MSLTTHSMQLADPWGTGLVRPQWVTNLLGTEASPATFMATVAARVAEGNDAPLIVWALGPHAPVPVEGRVKPSQVINVV